jgi:hypothetical protein
MENELYFIYLFDARNELILSYISKLGIIFLLLTPLRFFSLLHFNPKEYKSHLSRIRTYLASSHRDPNTLQDCERLIQDAKRCATAMQAMAEVEGNTMRVTEARQLLERDIGPLSKEIQRTIQTLQIRTNQNELLLSSMSTTNNNTYQAPGSSHFDVESQQRRSSDLDALIQNSDYLLRESQSILAETEYIGDQTIQQMLQQREQLTNAQRSLHAVQTAMTTSGRILKSMSRRACRSRLALHMMIGVLISLNLFVLYCIYEKHTQHKSSDTPP